MEREPDRLAWLALLIVDEAAEQADSDWIGGSLGLRLALAYLCSIADGPTFALPSRRHIFDRFWTTVTQRHTRGNPNAAAYARQIMIRTCQQQIGRQLRFGENIFNVVRRARTPEAGDPRQQVANAVRQADDDRARARWRKRQGYFGRSYPGDPKMPPGR